MFRTMLGLRFLYLYFFGPFLSFVQSLGVDNNCITLNSRYTCSVATCQFKFCRKKKNPQKPKHDKIHYREPFVTKEKSDDFDLPISVDISAISSLSWLISTSSSCFRLKTNIKIRVDDLDPKVLKEVQQRDTRFNN